MRNFIIMNNTFLNYELTSQHIFCDFNKVYVVCVYFNTLPMGVFINDN